MDHLVSTDCRTFTCKSISTLWYRYRVLLLPQSPKLAVCFLKCKQVRSSTVVSAMTNRLDGDTPRNRKYFDTEIVRWKTKERCGGISGDIDIQV